MRIRNDLVRQLLAEMFATFLLVCVGVGSVAQFVLYGSMPSMSIAIAFSFSIAMGVIVAGNISGL
jgi:glycerol uptake facilitator-like aquaporin